MGHIKKILIGLGIVLALPVSCVGYLVTENYFRDKAAQEFCDLIDIGMSRQQAEEIAAEHELIDSASQTEIEMRFTVWDNMGVAGTACLVKLHDAQVIGKKVFGVLG